MRRFLLLTAVLFLFSQAGCTRAVRYSAEEIKDFPPAIQENIKKSEITTGMTMAQVRYSWGAPDSITALAPSDNGKERVQWIYKRMQMFTTKLVFTADNLTEIVSTEPGLIKQQ